MIDKREPEFAEEKKTFKIVKFCMLGSAQKNRLSRAFSIIPARRCPASENRIINMQSAFRRGK